MNIIDMVQATVNATTLKQSKIDLDKLAGMLNGYNPGIKAQLESTMQTRSKAKYNDEINFLVDMIKSIKAASNEIDMERWMELNEMIEVEDTNNVTDEKETITMAEIMDKVAAELTAVPAPATAAIEEVSLVRDKSSLKAIANSIKKELEKAQAGFLKVGALLCQAQEHIKATKGTQKEFLAWADESVNLKKAQTYKLMQVYREYGAESEFAGVSMRVLYNLIGQPEKVVELAKIAASKGELDSNELDSIIISFEPAKVDKVAPVIETPSSKALDVPMDLTEFEKANLDRQIKSVIETPDHVIETPVPSKVAPKASTSNAGSTEQDTIAALQATIDKLNKTIDILQDELKMQRSDKSKPWATLPELPQFDSACPATVIGIELINAGDKVKVNKAYRYLATIYTAATAPKAAAKLLAARETLLKSCM